MDTERPFELWIELDPLEKSLAEAEDGRSRPISGFASTDDEDLQRDIMVQDGIDTSPFLSKGFFDWDHKGHLGPQYLIGEPEFCEVRKVPNRGEGLFVKGFLYENNPLADAAWEMLQRTATGNSRRQLGFSIEGGVLPGGRHGKYIKKAVVRHVALTHQPVNPYTFAQLAKSLTVPDDMTVLHINNCQECLESALAHLMEHKSMTQEDAVEVLYELSTRGLF